MADYSLIRKSKSLLAKMILAMLLVLVILVHWSSRLVLRIFWRKSGKSTRLVMLGTFYNPGWFKAHVVPLAKSALLDEIIVVCDAPVSFRMDKVSFECPSQGLITRVGRNAARLITVLRVGWRLKPQLYMGYHIMPNALLSLFTARLLGGKAIYQMTGGPAQIVGGGYLSENPLLRATAEPSKLLEYILFSLVRCFDAIIVRGSSAVEFVKKNKLNQQCLTVTGAINIDIFAPSSAMKEIDILYVARLIPEKGHKRFINVVALVKEDCPDVNVVIVGDGPLREELESKVNALSLEKNIEFLGRSDDIPELLEHSKIYVLLSDTEGMSIAVLEAMGSGLPVIVCDVGDLGDAVHHDETGYLLNLDSTDSQIAGKLLVLLSDEQRRKSLGLASHKLIANKYSVEALASRWDDFFEDML